MKFNREFPSGGGLVFMRLVRGAILGAVNINGA